MVLRILEPIWAEKPETASRVRGRMSDPRLGQGPGLPEGENPARWRGHLDKLLPSAPTGRTEHHAALPYDEIGSFIEKVRAQEGTAARALEFTILASTRTQEVIGAKPEEFDLKKALWTIPAGRMKRARSTAYRCPRGAIEIIKAQPAGTTCSAARRKARR